MQKVYPICPGRTTFEICSPLFNLIRIKVGDSKYFTIQAKNDSDKNIYIQSARLNGKDLLINQIGYKDIMNGDLLELEMGEKPVSN